MVAQVQPNFLTQQFAGDWINLEFAFYDELLTPHEARNKTPPTKIIVAPEGQSST
jgi:hypothetical protein